MSSGSATTCIVPVAPTTAVGGEQRGRRRPCGGQWRASFAHAVTSNAGSRNGRSGFRYFFCVGLGLRWKTGCLQSNSEVSGFIRSTCLFESRTTGHVVSGGDHSRYTDHKPATPQTLTNSTYLKRSNTRPKEVEDDSAFPLPPSIYSF